MKRVIKQYKRLIKDVLIGTAAGIITALILSVASNTASSGRFQKESGETIVISEKTPGKGGFDEHTASEEEEVGSQKAMVQDIHAQDRAYPEEVRSSYAAAVRAAKMVSEKAGDGTEIAFDKNEIVQVSEVETLRTGKELPAPACFDIASHQEKDTPEEAPGSAEEEPPLLSVNGSVMAPDLQGFLYEALSERGIGYFFRYAVLIAFAESSFNHLAVSKNGMDKGLFQYREIYYPGKNIFDPREQIIIFSDQMANRASKGKTIAEMISAHNMSDYGAYNQAYVDIVMANEKGLKEVR